MALQEAQHALTERRQAFAKERDKLACLEEWETLRQKRRLHEKAESSQAKDLEKAQNWQARLQQHRQVEVYTDEILSWRRLTERESTLTSETKRTQERTAKLKAAAEEKAQQLAQRKETHHKAQTELGVLTKLIEQVSPLDRERRLRSEQGQAFTKQIADHQAVGKPLAESLKRHEGKLETLLKTLEETDRWLSKHAKDASLAETLPAWQRQFDSVAQLDEQLAARKNVQAERRQRVESFTKTLAEQRTQKEKLKATLSEHDALVKREETNEATALAGRSPQEWESAQRQLQEKRLLFTSIFNKAQQYGRAKERYQQATNVLRRPRTISRRSRPP